MHYVVMNVGTQHLYPQSSSPRVYRTLAAARAQTTRLNNEYQAIQWQALSMDDYQAQHNPMVKTRNLMSGAEVLIRRSELGTCTDPGTERYWSM